MRSAKRQEPERDIGGKIKRRREGGDMPAMRNKQGNFYPFEKFVDSPKLQASM